MSAVPITDAMTSTARADGIAPAVTASPRALTSPILPSARLRAVFSFPNAVDEWSARTVAAGVVVMAVTVVATRQWWILIPLVYGFAARVLTGPTLSPLGRLATQVVRPRLPFGARPVPGPPKRFAQAMGLTFSGAAAIAVWGFGAPIVALGLVGALAAAAFAESAFGLCLGCVIFGYLMRVGLISESVCEDCADITRRRASTI